MLHPLLQQQGMHLIFPPQDHPLTSDSSSLEGEEDTEDDLNDTALTIRQLAQKKGLSPAGTQDLILFSQVNFFSFLLLCSLIYLF